VLALGVLLVTRRARSTNLMRRLAQVTRPELGAWVEAIPQFTGPSPRLQTPDVTSSVH